MPKTPKTKLKQPALPVPVQSTGDPWEPSGPIPATVPLPNDVIITKVEGPYTERDRKLWAFLVAAVWEDLATTRIHEMRVAKINAIFEELGGGTSSSWIWDSARRLSRTIVEWECGAGATYRSILGFATPAVPAGGGGGGQGDIGGLGAIGYPGSAQQGTNGTPELPGVGGPGVPGRNGGAGGTPGQAGADTVVILGGSTFIAYGGAGGAAIDGDSYVTLDGGSPGVEILGTRIN